jgi:hypothetical protein
MPASSINLCLQPIKIYLANKFVARALGKKGDAALLFDSFPTACQFFRGTSDDIRSENYTCRLWYDPEPHPELWKVRENHSHCNLHERIFLETRKFTAEKLRAFMHAVQNHTEKHFTVCF